jgi:hypothetical protein
MLIGSNFASSARPNFWQILSHEKESTVPPKKDISNSSIGRRALEEQLQSERIEESRFACYSLKSICIPRSTAILGDSCFPDAMIGVLICQLEWQLQSAPDSCFQNAELKNASRLGGSQGSSDRMEREALKLVVKGWEDDPKVAVIVTGQISKVVNVICTSCWNVTREYDANRTNNALDCYCEELAPEE